MRAAAAGEDYVHARGRAFFEDGQIEARILVEVLDERTRDPAALVFKVVLSDPQGVSVQRHKEGNSQSRPAAPMDSPTFALAFLSNE